MTARVAWLPKGHITHGYRRVFTVCSNDGALQHVVVFVPMPYEAVFEVSQMADGVTIEDPSLWWGLSIVVRLIADGTLLTANEELADDGYLQMRPPLLSAEELLPAAGYQAIAKQGFLDVETGGGLSDGQSQ